MCEAAQQFHFPEPEGGVLHQVHYLTGRGHWHLSVFAAGSLAIQTKGAVQPIFHSDGTLDRDLAAHLQGMFPASVCVYGEEQSKLMVRYAPPERYPVLNKLWHEFPLIRKILSVHLWREGWNLCLDSDMLFWLRPDFLLEWLGDPEKPICMKDFQYAYSVGREAVNTIAGLDVPPLINTGVIGLHSSMIDADKLESQAKALLAAKGTRHFLEQTMTAMLLSSRGFEFAPPKDYGIPSSAAECSTTATVCQHYTPRSRGWMYGKGWREIWRMAEQAGYVR